MGFLSEDGKDLRPADLLLFNWLQGKDACLDVTCISPFAGMGASSWAPGVALHNAVEKKKRKYASICEENGYKFIPFAFSTFGEFDTEALGTLSRIKSISISHSNNAKSGAFIFHRSEFLYSEKDSIYENGKFCHTFHISKEQWTNCEFCEKPVHASCLVSFNEWIKIERGTQVMCIECSKINYFLVRKFYNLMDPADGIQTEPHYWPTSISPDPKIALVVLFERVLTYADQDIGFDYIRIPMIHAEAYLPKAIQSYAKYKFCIFDWDYNCWNVTISRVDKELHIIEGLKQYMISNNLKAGDTVTFYRLVPDGQYAISFRNAERRNHLLRHQPDV
ncbi:putative reverse transcriptase domain-containing protein [Tanacetum coccineum]